MDRHTFEGASVQLDLLRNRNDLGCFAIDTRCLGIAVTSYSLYAPDSLQSSLTIGSSNKYLFPLPQKVML